jgi:hypothetical protein
VKESNYFNAVQSIAETFKCWPKIEVNHNENGEIIPFDSSKPEPDSGKRVFF